MILYHAIAISIYKGNNISCRFTNYKLQCLFYMNLMPVVLGFLQIKNKIIHRLNEQVQYVLAEQ